MSMSRPTLLTTLFAAVVLTALTGCESEPEVPGFEPAMRLLTEEQYRNVIRDLFGAHIIVASNFSPISRKDGLIATSSFALSREPRHLIVTLGDGRSFVADVVGQDESRALALLKIESPEDLPVATAMPRNEIEVGRFAIAVGRGLGTRSPAVSVGIVGGELVLKGA